MVRCSRRVGSVASGGVQSRWWVKANREQPGSTEISGSVKRKVGEGTAGIGGIRIMVFNISKDVLTEITSFNDGEYYFLGLLPGTYRAYLDPEQIGRAGYRSVPESIEFDIKPVVGGEIIENISFVLEPE